MIKRLLLLVCLAGGAHAAQAANGALTWNAAAMYVGKTTNPDTHTLANTWVAQIESRQADSTGYYEVWTDSQPFYRESFASQVAMEFRAACNKARSSACVRGQQPAWNGRLDKVIFIH